MAENIKSKLRRSPERKEIARAKFSEPFSRLAEPKRGNFVIEEEPIPPEIKKSTLKYKATKRIQNLAKPKFVNPKKISRESTDVLSQSISKVSPRALSYKASRRIVELAQPK